MTDYDPASTAVRWALVHETRALKATHRLLNGQQLVLEQPDVRRLRNLHKHAMEWWVQSVADFLCTLDENS